MQKGILFCNETKITDKNFKSIMFYNKFFYYRNITVLKLSICIFIIVGSIILLDISLFVKMLYIFAAIVGIIDTFQVKQQRLECITMLKYEFFDDYFKVNNNEIMIEFEYNCIEHIIEKEKYYYLIVRKSVMMISKDGFILGNNKEVKKFIEDKIKSVGY